jgi:hypothetical protein
MVSATPSLPAVAADISIRVYSTTHEVAVPSVDGVPGVVELLCP